MYLTPHRTSAMAMFGFVYLWYLLAVLVLEIWLDYRRDIVLLSQTHHRLAALALPRADAGLDQHQPARASHRRTRRLVITVIGIPSAFLLHGYVGFHLRLGEGQPVVVIAADAGGVSLLRDGLGHRGRHAAVHAALLVRGQPIDMRCVDTVAKYLFYTFIIDFSLEMLDLFTASTKPMNPSAASISWSTRSSISPRSWFRFAGHAGADRAPGDDPVAEADRTRPQTDLCTGGMPDAHRDFCHALERGHRRPALFQEFSRIHDLQDGLRDHAKACSPQSR